MKDLRRQDNFFFSPSDNHRTNSGVNTLTEHWLTQGKGREDYSLWDYLGFENNFKFEMMTEKE